jgi:copper chaperone CopZ
MGSGPAAFGGPTAIFGAPGGGGVIHASYTVKGANGSYETIDTQVGTVQGVSSTSLTVESADSFLQTYDVTSSTIVDADYEGILSLKMGDTVSVQALADGTTVTAQRVQDITQLQANRPAAGRWSWTGRPGPVAPTTTTTTTTGSTTTTDPGAA